MTVHFTPGDANSPLASHHQAQWRDHHIIAYGSGNNLIIHTVTAGCQGLQTMCLPEDLTGVSINPRNGLIAISCGFEIVVYRPLNEYMSAPKWTEALRVAPDSTRVLCVRWAPLENELAAGTLLLLTLYHISFDYGHLDHVLRWQKVQPAPVEALDITVDGSKIISYTFSHFDSFARVWMRLSYGDTSSLFDLVYADHMPSNYLVYFQWRGKPGAEKTLAHNDALASMLHIKNIRSFMPSLSLSLDDNDILYTVTNDFVLHVWATCDFNGHSYLKHWSQYDLTAALGEDYVSFLILDGARAKTIQQHFDTSAGPEVLHSSDYLLVIGHTETRFLRVSHVTSNPPNSITFDEIYLFQTDATCIPSYSLQDVRVDETTLAENEAPDCNDVSKHVRQNSGPSHQNPVDHFITGNYPVACQDPMAIKSSSGCVSFLVHDRVKSTIRSVSLAFSKKPKLQLREKFQGHGKSVKKMYTSSSSHEGNIMLSLLNFPDHNYIWEPFTIGNAQDSSMAITKRFRLNVTRDPSGNLHEQGIENAVLLNDIFPAKNDRRHHLAVAFEKGGFVSLWECDGSTMDDQEAALVTRVKAESRGFCPQAFFMKSLSPLSYIIVAIYDPSHVETWKIDIKSRISLDGDAPITCKKIMAQALPGEYAGFARIAAVETFLEKDLTLIDASGLLRSVSMDYDVAAETVVWTETLRLQTNIENASFVHGASLVGKVAIVNVSGDTLSIWDSKTGVLEYEESFLHEYGPVCDLDWTFLGLIESAANPLLAVGFSRFVLLYTQLRYDYTNKVATFAALKKIDISDYSSHEIGDLIWLDDSYLVISSGNQFFIDDKWVSFGQDSQALGNNFINSTIRQLLVGYKSDHSNFPIADLVRILNGPLPVYHPQFLIQALLIDETDLVEAVLVNLLQSLRDNAHISWNLDIPWFGLLTLKSENLEKLAVFDIGPAENDDIFDTFNSNVADLLSEKLTSISLPLLTRHQQTTLRNLVILMSKLSLLRKSLDANGMKYLYGFELFQASHKQTRLTIRDINWAVHSDQKEMLFAAIENHYGRLTWSSVKAVGLAYWVDVHRLRATMESAARNEFADERSPSGRVSILYLAIKKKQVLLGLWRTVSHPEKDKMVKFLSHNFSEPRWQSAALKNAFVLLGKHRYMDAAYFFLLAEKVKDCCMTLCNRVQEFDLALAVARVNSAQEAVKTILEQYILPEALVTGDRWTTSWVFWEMKLKEVSIQALAMAPIDVVAQNTAHFTEAFLREIDKLEIRTRSKSFLRVDPALGVLYQKLRSSKLRYLQGSKAVLPQVEFDFVVRLSTIYSRMGCDYLSLLLLRDWKFLDYSPKTEKREKAANAKSVFLDFSGAAKQQKLVPEPSTFEESDLSAFSFGF